MRFILSTKLLHRNTVLLFLFFIIVLMGNMNGFITVATLWSLLLIILLPLHKYIDSQCVVLVLFSILYAIFGKFTGFAGSIHQTILCLLPVAFYLFGSYIIRYFDSERMLLVFILLMLSLYSFEVYSTIIKEISSTGSIVNTSRLFYFHGDQSRQLTATLVGLNVSVGMIGVPMCIILKKYRILRWLYLAIGCLSIITTIYLVNRSGLFILFLSLSLICIYYYKKQRVRLLFICLSLLFLFMLLKKLGIIGTEVFDAYYRRNSVDLLTGGDRPRRWLEALSDLFHYPFGWADNNGTTSYYIHNMWLDIAKVVGIIPFTLLVLATVMSLNRIPQLFRRERDYVAASLLGMHVCFFSSCFLEPVYGGLHLCLYVMVWGMTNSYLRIES